MPRWAVGVLVAPWLLVTASPAQRVPFREHQLSVAGGPLLLSQRDGNASPLRYGGTVPSFQAGYAVLTHRQWFALRLGGGLGRLRSDLTQGNRPRQEAWRGWIETEYAHVLITSAARTRWFLGARLAAHGTATHHFYADPGGSEAGYTFFSAALGPMVALERSTGVRSSVSAWLGAPVVALLARPYLGGGFLSEGGALHVRVAALDVFQAAQLTAAYTTEIGRGTDIVLGYHAVVERYRDTQPYHFASQDLCVALQVRFGGDQ